jgi:FKBP12-rapamycin complex-associated protein
VQERWYEKLHDWQRALGIYKSKADEAPKDPDLILGRLRCVSLLSLLCIWA